MHVRFPSHLCFLFSAPKRPLVEPKLTPRRVAEAIGVSESSLKRWADDGRIVVHRTVGGHRRMHHAEVFQFIRTAGLKVVRPDLLGLPPEADVSSPAGRALEPGNRLSELLCEGHAFGVHALLLNLYLDGASIAELCDGPICEAMHGFGTLWHDEPERGITTEHLAMTTLVQGIGSLRAAVTPDCHGAENRSKRPLALGCAPSGDPFLLPSMLAAWVLAEAGCCDLNLGPETPLDALVDAVEHHKPVVTWIALLLGRGPPHRRRPQAGASGPPSPRGHAGHRRPWLCRLPPAAAAVPVLLPFDDRPPRLHRRAAQRRRVDGDRSTGGLDDPGHQKPRPAHRLRAEQAVACPHAPHPAARRNPHRRPG